MGCGGTPCGCSSARWPRSTLSQVGAAELGIALCFTELQTPPRWYRWHRDVELDPWSQAQRNSTTQAPEKLRLSPAKEGSRVAAVWGAGGVLRAGNAGVKWWLLIDGVVWGFFLCNRRGTCWRKIRMKRKTSSCEFLRGGCRERHILAAHGAGAGGVERQKLCPATWWGLGNQTL